MRTTLSLEELQAPCPRKPLWAQTTFSLLWYTILAHRDSHCTPYICTILLRLPDLRADRDTYRNTHLFSYG